jgi:nitroimidazol reductase NimA-like FMN-containing flavoprotein (pyridoxamine 5'-phosphate oxidase superfamily)
MTGPTTEPTERTRVKRLPERARYDRAAVHGILDEGLIAHVGFLVDGQPFVIPMAYGRDGDRLLLHGSVASRLQRALAEGVEVCATVTLLDGLVLARSTFHHSMDYRSVAVFGTARRITDPVEAGRALERIVDHIVPGRSTEARAPSDAELRQTSVLELPLDEASAKVRTGGPNDDPDDLPLPVWAGVLPLATVPAAPEPADDLAPGIAVPASVQPWRRPGA